MNKFNYYITTHFITSNKDYNFCHNSHSVYQTYPWCGGHVVIQYPQNGTWSGKYWIILFVIIVKLIWRLPCMPSGLA